MAMEETSHEPLPWLPVFETGVDAIDRQHRDLIADANRLYEVVLGRADWASVVAAIGKMHRACALHFAEEDKLLVASAFPEAAAHALEHERVLGEVARIDGVVGAAPRPTALCWELALTLRSLLVDHLLRYDLQYKSHLMYYET